MTRSLPGILIALVALGLAPSLAQGRPADPAAAFAVLQDAARRPGAVKTSPQVIARERITRTLSPRGRVASDAKLLFDGKRARIQLSVETQLGGGATRRETHLLRVPLGRVLGWYGRALVRAQFPGLDPAQVMRSLRP